MTVWGLVLILLICVGCTGSSNEVAQTTQPPVETMVTTIQPLYTEPQEILNISYRDFNSMLEGTTNQVICYLQGANRVRLSAVMVI